MVVNGHIIDNIALFDASRSHRQPAQYFDNQGGRFTERREVLGLDEPLVGRGLAAGDLDRDGDLDLVITQNGDRALVLIAEGEARGRTLGVRLRGTTSNPDGIGARLEVKAGGRTQHRQVFGGGSYLSQGASEQVFGLGGAGQVEELVVRWPSGTVDRLRGIEPGWLVITEGDAPVEAEKIETGKSETGKNDSP